MGAAAALAGRAFGIVPLWVWVALAFAVSILTWGAYQRGQVKDAMAAAVKAQQDLAQVQADAAKVAIDALAVEVSTQRKAVREAQDSATQDRAAAAAAGDALQRLRQRYAATTASGGAASAPAGGSQAATDGAGVCAGLLDGVGALARRYADIANNRGRAGQACERIADVEVKPDL